jgi:protein gp37
MVENSNIEWTDHSFNPWIGCTKVSAACENCYAEKFDARFGHSWGPHVRRRTSAANWRKPLAWNKAAQATGKRTRVFCASLADVFDNDRSITSGWRGDLWHLIHRTPHLDWMLLTKRPQNIARFLRPEEYGDLPAWGDGWPNVWLGTTVENQTEADRRIPHLLAVPAAVRFLSCEPLLGPVDLTCLHIDGLWFDALAGVMERHGPISDGLDLVICGGESGSGARPMHPDWARHLRDQCIKAGVAFHFKQWGEWAPGESCNHIPTRSEHVATWWNNEWSFDCITPSASMEMHRDDEPDLFKVGKKRAGRLLDGRTWDQMPGGMQ